MTNSFEGDPADIRKKFELVINLEQEIREWVTDFCKSRDVEPLLAIGAFFSAATNMVTHEMKPVDAVEYLHDISRQTRAVASAIFSSLRARAEASPSNDNPTA